MKQSSEAKVVHEQEVEWCPECLKKMQEIEAGLKRLAKKYGKHRLYAVEGLQKMLHTIEKMYGEGKFDEVQRMRYWIKWVRAIAPDIL